MVKCFESIGSGFQGTHYIIQSIRPEHNIRNGGCGSDPTGSIVARTSLLALLWEWRGCWDIRTSQASSRSNPVTRKWWSNTGRNELILSKENWVALSPNGVQHSTSVNFILYLIMYYTTLLQRYIRVCLFMWYIQYTYITTGSVSKMPEWFCE